MNQEDSLSEDIWREKYEALKLKYDEKSLWIHQYQAVCDSELKLVLIAERKRIKALESKLRVAPPLQHVKPLAPVADTFEYKPKYVAALNELQQLRLALRSKQNIGIDVSVGCVPEELTHSVRIIRPPQIVVNNAKLHSLEKTLSENDSEISKLKQTNLALKGRLSVCERLLAERRSEIKVLLEKNDLNNAIIAELHS